MAYSRKVLDHFAHPRNVGAIENPDGYARVQSPIHDDMVELTIRVENGRLADVKFRTFGCVAAIAASSAATELAIGMPLEEAAQMTNEQVSAALDGLPDSKVECSILVPTALRIAIDEYYVKHPEARPAGDTQGDNH